MPRKPKTISFWRGRLPHWEVEDGRYFVTMHLAGAIPQAGEDRIHELAAQITRLAESSQEEKVEVQRQVFKEMEHWLDQVLDVAYLREPTIAEMVMEAIAYRNDRDWRMLEYVIMPNHVHLFFEIAETAPVASDEIGRLKPVLEQFKRWTGHRAAKLLKLSDARFWQDEWFDHWSRSDEEDERIIEYIRRNPAKAGLVQDPLEWPHGSWRK